MEEEELKTVERAICASSLRWHAQVPLVHRRTEADKCLIIVIIIITSGTCTCS